MYLTFDALLYQELPMICRGKQCHEFFQHTQNLKIFLFFLPLEFSVRDRKNVTLKEKAIFLPYSIMVQTFIPFLTFKMKSTSDDGVFIAKKKSLFYTVYIETP